MTKVGVVYFSGTGTTKALAQEIIIGIDDAGAKSHVLELLPDQFDSGRWHPLALADPLDQCEAIILGTPTYMGGTSSQMKAFMDAMAPRWFTQAWRDKYAGAFTASSLAAGDKGNTLVDIATFAMQMGMIWVGTGGNFSEGVNQNGFYFGAGATASTPDQLSDIDKATGRHVGARIARFANTVTTITPST